MRPSPASRSRWTARSRPTAARAGSGFWCADIFSIAALSSLTSRPASAEAARRPGYSDGVTSVSVEAAGPSTLAGVGVDFWIAPYLRIGPAFTYRWTLLTDVRSCVGASCETSSISDRGAVGSFASLSFVATLALGREM